jgi:hypothetical protein
MYTYTQGLGKNMGLSIITDSGINSVHSLIISKIDLGIEKFSNQKKNGKNA